MRVSFIAGMSSGFMLPRKIENMALSFLLLKVGNETLDKQLSDHWSWLSKSGISNWGLGFCLLLQLIRGAREGLRNGELSSGTVSSRSRWRSKFCCKKLIERMKEYCMFYSNLRWESEEGGDIRHDPGNKMASFTFKIHILISANVFYLLVIKQNYAVAIGFKVL